MGVDLLPEGAAGVAGDHPDLVLGDPGEAVGELAPAQTGLQEGIAAVMDVLSGRVSLEPETGLADGRRTRLRSIDLGDGTIKLTCRTLPGSDR